MLPFEAGERRAETYKKCDSFLYSVCLSVISKQDSHYHFHELGMVVSDICTIISR